MGTKPSKVIKRRKPFIDTDEWSYSIQVA